MSSRVLRKLQGENTLVTGGQDENSEPEESDLTSSGGTRRKQLNINRYDLFNQLSHSESEAKEDDNDTETATGHAAGVNDISENVGDVSRRKKKKKKKKMVKSTSNQKSSEDNAEIDEVERSVREVNRILGETPLVPHTSEDKSTSSRKNIFSIEQRFLKPNNELKRIFGAKIVQSEQSKRRARGRGHVKSAWLVAPRENWSPLGKTGVTMKQLHRDNGSQYFKFEHSPSYQHIQMTFLRAVESIDPNNIVAIINSHPYHNDALLQLSDMCKMSEDLQMAAELNERVLYCLEAAFHPSFNLALGTCRLDYRQQENRALFIALFKHLIFVGQRACYRTALEFCKLLLSLNPEQDPMAVVLCIDFYAIKASEYSWLLQAAHEWETTKNISQLPNFAMSIAVAQFYLAEDGDLTTADLSLQNALIMFPSVLVPLLEKCSVQSDARVLAHPFFTVLNQVSQRPALTQLVALYVARSYHMWKDSTLLPWLERNVHRVLERVDAGDPLVEECHDKRLKRYHKPPREVLRHILLTDIKEVTATLVEGVEGSVLSYDPLPPLDAVNVYTLPPRNNLFEDSTVSMFFRSLMPTFNVNQRLAENDQADGEGAVGGGAVADFQRSVTSLVDAMRNLLSRAEGADADNDGDDDEGEDTHDEMEDYHLDDQ